MWKITNTVLRTCIMSTAHYGLVDYINKGLQIGLIPSWACSRDTRGLHQPKKLGLY